MRSCASLLRGVAAPLGCVALLPLLVQHDLLGYQQRKKIRRNCRHKLYPELFHIAFFNFARKRPTFAFTGESGYTLGLHAETGVFRMGGAITTLGLFHTFRKPCVARG